MGLNDSISDLFARIRNAQMVRKSSLRHPYSGLALAVAQVMVREGYLGAVSTVPKVQSVHRDIELFLKYQHSAAGEMRGAIRELRRVSKPSRRVYASIDDLPLSKGGLGRYILSTSGGVLSDAEARKRRLGGEVLGEIF